MILAGHTHREAAGFEVGGDAPGEIEGELELAQATTRGADIGAAVAGIERDVDEG